ncbi:protein kinase [Magnetospira sp. QH-2]|uniref:protein kinase n=1 Tax=Magnetospira sp. (strain QH-2) TaxID=1288970 RepID=UPI0003E815F2|nr:protein kinase [Magnetospira sp. QH-2]CCQ73405.1 Putative serine/threonine protein kinase [Magnetospira sp. QH-2]
MDQTTAYRPIATIARQPFHTRYIASGEGGRPLVVIKRFEAGMIPTEDGPRPPTIERLDLMRQAFIAELKLLRDISHENIMPLMGANEAGDSPFMVLPLLPMTLRDLIWAPAKEGRGREAARMPLDSALAILRQLLDALEELHGRAVVHRQLAPAAIWLAPDGRLVLDGFGLAKTPDWDLFSDGGGSGPVGFASPEQLVDASSVDARSDICSFGRIAYRLICGRVAEAKPLPPTDIDPTIDRALGEWMMSCMAEDPKDRPADVAAVREVMETLA